eukprot:11888417-Alexandrium_andersonii.AAC.1
MQLTIAVARELARLQTALVCLVGTAEGNEAQEQLEGHCRIAQRLRQLRDVPEDAALDAQEAERGADLPSFAADELLHDIPGGHEAAEQLSSSGAAETSAARLFKWFTARVVEGERPAVL